MRSVPDTVTAVLLRFAAYRHRLRRARATRPSALLLATEEVCEECANSAALIVIARDHGLPLPALLPVVQESAGTLSLSPALTRVLIDMANILYAHPEIGLAAARHMAIAGCIHALAYKEPAHDTASRY